MRMLKFAVEGQQLAKRGDFAGVTAGSKGYLRCPRLLKEKVKAILVKSGFEEITQE